MIKEARRRARRRRAAYLAAALLALAIGVGVFSAFGGGSSAPRERGEGRLPPSRGATVRIRDTFPLSLRDTALFSARKESLYALVISPDHARSVTVARLGGDGSATTRPVRFDEPNYLMDISAGPEGVYAGTSVIKRFTSRPDELVRIDPGTLSVRARATFPASVATVAEGRNLWAAMGDGRILRLDPRTLAVLASRRVARADPGAGGSSLSKPAFGLGSLWVLGGGARDRELVRLDPTTLAIQSRTRLPTAGRLYQALTQVVAETENVYLVGSAVVPVDRAGKLAARPALIPGLQTAAIDGRGLVGLTNGRPAIVVLDARGRVVGRTPVIDAGGILAVSGENAWFLGNAGGGDGLVHVELPRR